LAGIQEREKLVQVRDYILHVGSRFSLEAHRDAGEALIINYTAEWFEAHLAFADVLMAIDA
jgi:hypothetical protein